MTCKIYINVYMHILKNVSPNSSLEELQTRKRIHLNVINQSKALAYIYVCKLYLKMSTFLDNIKTEL